MKRFGFISIITFAVALIVILVSCGYDPYDPPARVRRQFDNALYDHLENVEGMDRTEAEKFVIEGYVSIEELTEGRIFISDKKIAGAMYVYTDDPATFSNCYAVDISSKDIYRKMSNTDGASNPVYVRVSPVLLRETAEKLLREVMDSASEQYSELLKDTFSITGDVTSDTDSGVMVYGFAVPENGDYDMRGTIIQESNLIVYDPDPGHVIYSTYFNGGGYAYLGTTTGTNAMGGTVTVYEYGTPIEAKQALWNYYGAVCALENLAEYFD